MDELIQTPYGEVLAEGLAELQASFDTRQMLAAVDDLDRFCAQSLVLDCGLTAGNIDPPGQENYGPRTDGALASCRSSRQLKSTPSSHLVHEITGFQPNNLNN